MLFQIEKEGKGMDFKEYSEKFLNEESPLGDLARDMKSDGGFPETNEYEKVEGYLLYMGACYEALRAAEEMFEKYSEEVK